MSAITIVDGYLPHALAAVEVLRAHRPLTPGTQRGRAQPRTVAPRVAALSVEAAIAGLVILAGGTDRCTGLPVHQARYLASLDPGQPVPCSP